MSVGASFCGDKLVGVAAISLCTVRVREHLNSAFSRILQTVYTLSPQNR